MGYVLFIGGCLLALLVIRPLTSGLRRAKAAVVVENAFEAHQPWVKPSAGAHHFANQLMGDLCHQSPEVLLKQGGQGLNENVVAGIALARGLGKARPGSEDEKAIFLALGAVNLMPINTPPNDREIAAMAYARDTYIAWDAERNPQP